MASPEYTDQPAKRQPTLIGRLAEMQALTSALERAVHGQGSIVMLAGEMGIGKTRLAQEALRVARSRQFLLMEGRASALTRSLTYAPVLDAIGPFLNRLDPVHRQALTRDLPYLSRLFDGLPAPAPEPTGDVGLERARLLEATARLVARIAFSAPVVLFFDDLHWADTGTLELLHYVGRNISDQRVLLLGSYRPDEADGVRCLRDLVTSLGRSGSLAELHLKRLTREEMGALIRNVLGGEPPPGLLAYLATRTDGTPLFVDAVLRTLMEEAQLTRRAGRWEINLDPARPVPPDIHRLILDRLELLRPEQRHLVNLIGLLGPEAPHDLLLTASSLIEPLMLEAIQSLRQKGLVLETAEAAVLYRLAHPIIQEVAYSDQPEMARRRAHAAVAAAMEQTASPDPERLARQYRGAGTEADPDLALAAFLAASNQAARRYAYDEAAVHLSAALSIVRTGRRHDLLPDLMERLGSAWERLGELEAAVSIWNETLQLLTGPTRIADRIRLHRRLTLAYRERGLFSAAEEHLKLALSHSEESGAEQDAIDLAFDLMELLHREIRFAEAAAQADRVKVMTGKESTAKRRAQFAWAQFTIDVIAGRYGAALSGATKTAAVAREAGEAQLQANAQGVACCMAWKTGDHRLSCTLGEEAASEARRMGIGTAEWTVVLAMTFAHLVAGDLGAALASSDELLELSRRVGVPLAFPLGQRAVIFIAMGDLAPAKACIDEARAISAEWQRKGRQDGFDRGMLTWFADALLALEEQRFDDAIAAARSKFTPDLPEVMPVVQKRVLAEAQAAAGDLAGALQTAASLAAIDTGPGGYSKSVALLAEGIARALAGETEGAIACLRRAEEGCAALEVRLETGRARYELGRLLAGTDLREARTMAREAFLVFEKCGAHRWAARARQLLTDLGVRGGVSRRAAGTLLSERELEVARLVAAGMTNAQVANHLCVTPRTVATHLERIYPRLGVKGRLGLTRLLIDEGLVAAPNRGR